MAYNHQTMLTCSVQAMNKFCVKFLRTLYLEL